MDSVKSKKRGRKMADNVFINFFDYLRYMRVLIAFVQYSRFY